MERILRILLLITILGGGDAFNNNPRSPHLVHQRYGGGHRRPPAMPNNQEGGFMYSPPMPLPPPGPSISYARPFGMPEGQRFPHAGHTLKIPDESPPLPPFRSNYISKPYPDFVVKFKSPLYPTEVNVVEQPRPPSTSVGGYGGGMVAPVPPAPNANPVVPIYKPSLPPKSPIPIYETMGVNGEKQIITVLDTFQDVNVGTSYQTASGIAGGAPLAPAIYGNVPLTSVAQSGPLFSPPSSQLSTLMEKPPATSVYVISGPTAAEKLQAGGFSLVSGTPTGNGKPDEATAFFELSKDAVFGSTPEPGVIKPLTPNIVYSPDKQDFKPMYLLGPVYYPKSDDGSKDSAGSGSSHSEFKSGASGIDCTRTTVNGTVTDPNCPPSNQSTVKGSIPVPTNEEGKSQNSAAAAETVSSDEAVPVASSSGGTGSRRGLIRNFIKDILGVVDEDPSNDREDSDVRQAEEDEAEDSDTIETGGSSSSNRNRGAGSSARNRPKKVKGHTSGSRYQSSSSSWEKSPDAGSRHYNYNDRRDASSSSNRFPSTHHAKFSNSDNPSQLHSSFGDQPQLGLIGQGDPDPILGPVQIGFLGGPPQDIASSGNAFDPRQPFFYPAGIPTYAGYATGPEYESAISALHSQTSAGAEHTQRADAASLSDLNGHPSSRHQYHNLEVQSTAKQDGGVDAIEGNVQETAEALPPITNGQTAGQDGSFDGMGSEVAQEHPQPKDPQPADLSVAPSAEVQQPIPYDGEAAANVIADKSSVASDESNPEHNNPVTESDSQQLHSPVTPSQNVNPTSYAHKQPISYDHPNSNLFYEQERVDSSSYSDPHQVFQTGSSDSHHYQELSTTEDAYLTYPQTNSYPGPDYDSTIATAYTDNSDLRVNYATDQYQAASASNQEHHLEGPLTDSNTINEVDSNGASASVLSETENYVTTQQPLVSYDYYDSHGSLDHPLTNGISSTTQRPSYASVSRRPYPGFYRLHPKYRHYIPPTTYKPAYARLRASSAVSESHPTVLPQTYEDYSEAVDLLSSNSLNIDIGKAMDSSTMHSDTVVANSDLLIHVPEATTDDPNVLAGFGSRISPKPQTVTEASST